MVNLLSVAGELHHHIRSGQTLGWWAKFIKEWNGISILNSVSQPCPDFEVTSDTSGALGCGAFSSKGEWFMCQWPASWSRVHIMAKELFPIVVALAMLR